MLNYSQNALYGALPRMYSKVCYFDFKMVYLRNCFYYFHRFGPIVRFWCMRFEGKHNYFKDLAHRVRCYKNIPKTLARRHQHMMSYIFGTSSISNTPFEKDTSVGVCKYLKNNTFLTFHIYTYVCVQLCSNYV